MVFFFLVRRAVAPPLCVMLCLAASAACSATDRPGSQESSPLPIPLGSLPAGMLAPGTINTGMNERDATLTPDGSEFYFTVWSGSFGTIMVSKKIGDSWGKPEVASFSGVYSDLEPFVSPDGRRLFFASKRPVRSDSSGTDYNIWVADRTGERWAEPRPVTELAEPGADEYYPSVTAEGEIYFTSHREGGAGGEDIWRASPRGDGYDVPEPVPGALNTARDEFNAFVAPDGSYILFGSWGREDGLGGGDLYVSFREDSGSYGPGLNMGPAINSPSLDYSPYVSVDGSTLFYSTRRTFIEPPEGAWTYERLYGALSSPGNGQGDILHTDAPILDSLRVVAGR